MNLFSPMRVALLATMLGYAGLKAQVTIGTDTYNSHYSGGNYFGEVFTAPAGDTDLQSVAVNVSNQTSGQVLNAYLYAWNGSAVTGSALWSGSETTAYGGIENLTYSVADDLTAGSSYIFLISTDSGIAPGFNNSGGGLYFGPSATTLYSLGSQSLSSQETFTSDAVSPVPESSYLIYGGLALVLGLAAWCRSTRAPASLVA